MRYLKLYQLGYPEKTKYALLIHEHYYDLQTLQHFYLQYLPQDVLILSVGYDKPKLVSAKVAKAVVKECIEHLTISGVDTVFICDSRYFKYFTKQLTVSKALGKVIPCALDNNIKVLGSPNYGAIEHDPTNQDKITCAITALKQHLGLDNTEAIKLDITHVEEKDVDKYLARLHAYPEIAVDTETLSLKHYTKANVQTIAFAVSMTEGFAFRTYKTSVKAKLRQFFETYKGIYIFHNAYFDCKQLIYTLYMEHLEDFKGLKKGIETFKHNTHDTYIINKLLLNSTQDPDLSLKALAISYLGNYAEDVKDITKLSLPDLLTYNAKDAIATFWLFKTTFNKLSPKLLNFYDYLGIPSVFLCARISLTGMPIDPSKVDTLDRKLKRASERHTLAIRNHPAVVKATYILQVKRWKKRCKELKASIPNINASYEAFNPNSGTQLAVLFYEVLELPIPHTTAEGNPSTDAKAVKILKAQAPEIANLFENIQALADLSTIITTFIPAFRNYTRKTVSGYRLYGEFNSAGTQSFRLSSNSPNLMNLPSGSVYGKAVKALFVAHAGKKLGGADFAALEAKIDAILTGDPNKEKVYTEGFDSHCLNTYTYWPDKFPDIDSSNADSINSIETKYPKDRHTSKPVTFALTYLGSEYTLMNRAGFSSQEAKRVYENYWDLYAITKEHIEYIVNHAIEHGYVTLAFGAQLRTPTLHNKPVNYGLSSQEEAELRSAYNATSQSYGLLLNRALIELYDRLDAAPQYIQDNIEIVNDIHDAGYYHYTDDPTVEQWLAANVVECMSWQAYPPIQSNEIKLTADFETGLSWDTFEKITIKQEEEA